MPSHIDQIAAVLAAWIAEKEVGAASVRSRLAQDLQGIITYEDYIRSNPALLDHLAEKLPPKARVLDFGCGNLPMRWRYQRHGFDWTGLDYAESIDPAFVKGKSSGHHEIVYYDGVKVPFETAEFDLVWSSQALEHVQDIEVSFSEISRVLKPGAWFAGTVSFLEPYHARSTYCYTPYGFSLLLAKYAITLTGVGPAVDGLTLMLKRLCGMFGDTGEWDGYFKQGGLLTPIIRDKLAAEGFSETDIAGLLLQLCGHFRFVAVRN